MKISAKKGLNAIEEEWQLLLCGECDLSSLYPDIGYNLAPEEELKRDPRAGHRKVAMQQLSHYIDVN